MIKKLLSLLLLIQFSITVKCHGQDSLYAREVIKELTSEKYNGRGYVKEGDKKAAAYIAAEFRKHGLQPLNSKNYFQEFGFPVNTFPSCMDVSINGTTLTAGKDFIVDPGMKKTTGQYDIVRIEKNMVLYSKAEISGKWILLDTVGTGIQIKKDDWTAWKQNIFGAAGMIIVQPVKLTWSVSTEEVKFPVIEIVKSALPASPANIKLNICNKFIPRHETQNVIGYIPGKSNPDSYLFISAHYDHLGRMGTNAWFPGANDNASGIAMLLNLAKHYAQHPPEQSIVFIAFAGEEAGLIGSMYYTENPAVPLTSIKFLLNLDLLGTGDEGMMVVNATEYPQHFSRLDSINTQQQLLPKIGQRGKAANSDHYFFTEKGVPAFFCYTLGGISAYHDIYDVEKTLPLTRFKEVFQLFTEFLDTTK